MLYWLAGEEDKAARSGSSHALGESVYNVPGLSSKSTHASSVPAPPIGQHRREESAAFWISARGDALQKNSKTK